MTVPIIKQTADGTSTLFVPEMNEHYHSMHGAVQESVHVYIKNGFEYFDLPELHVFEMGFGTGLNAMLTAKIAEEKQVKVHYTSVEKFPIGDEIANQLYFGEEMKEYAKLIHAVNWESWQEISSYFKLKKIHTDIQDFNFENEVFDLVFFDAFAPDKQEELWTEAIFQKIYNSLKKNGIMVSYSVKGIVKQRLRAIGFTVKKLPGPPGKFHMLRAIKN